MSNKINNPEPRAPNFAVATTVNSSEEFKDLNSKYSLSRFDYDLYHDEENIAMPVVRVKHFTLPNKCERWKVFENAKIVFILEGNKLTGKEKKFLHTPEGVNFLLKQAKNGIKSFNKLRTEMKAVLQPPPKPRPVNKKKTKKKNKRKS